MSEIDYPNGASVKYTWTVNTQNSEQAAYDADSNATGIYVDEPGAQCVYRYSLPVVASRTVDYGNGPVLSQTYTYQTNWGATDWTTKTTTVTTTDLVSNKTSKTVYTYTPEPSYTNTDLFNQLSTTQSPVESTIQYYDGSSSQPVRTVHKGWTSGGDEMLCEVDTLEDQQTSSGKWLEGNTDDPDDIKEYDYGAVSATACNNIATPAPSGYTRDTTRTEAVSATNPLGEVLEEPSSVVVTDGSGNKLAETDFTYDGAPIQSIAEVSGLPAGTHDETNYAKSSTAPRGNVTTKTQQCLPSSACSSATLVTTYAYDKTGQLVAVKDPCGNAPCSDMAGSNYTTTYSYTDPTSGGNSAGESNAYLTLVTDPLGHTHSYAYNYTTGYLTSSTDENAQITTYQYSDSLNRPTKILSPPDPNNGNQNPQTTYTYNDSVPSVTTSTLQNTSNVWTTSVAIMDGLGHVTQTQLTSDPSGTDFVDTVYDGSGNIHSVSNPYRSTTETTYGITSHSYDALGRPTIQVQPDGSELQWCYDNIASAGQTNCNSHAGGQTTGTWIDSADEAGQ